MRNLANFIRKAPTALLWLIIVFLSTLLSHNAILYFTHGGDYGILPEKIVARQQMIWNICFYTHLPAGIICLIAPWLSFAKRIFSLHTIHSKVGKVYTSVTLFLVCPTGMVLAIYAKGGLITQIGFLLQGALLMYFTYKGYNAIKLGKAEEHLAHMIRSYSVAAVVLTFRVLHILFFLLNVPYQNNYAISQWLGLSLNLLFAEIIVFGTARKMNLSPLKKQFI